MMKYRKKINDKNISKNLILVLPAKIAKQIQINIGGNISKFKDSNNLRKITFDNKVQFVKAMKTLKKSVKDKPLFEVEHPAGEGWIDIPDKEIDEFLKKRLIEIANNSRLFEKYRKDIVDILEDELQEYANHQFYTKGRGELYRDNKMKDARGYTTYSFKGTYWEPPEWEGYVESDFSGTKIEYEDDTWANPDDEVGTYEEVLENFMENEIIKLEEGSEEWEKAKQWFIENKNYSDEDIKNAQFVKFKDIIDDDYADMMKWNSDELMNDYGYREINWRSHIIKWDEPDYDDYDEPEYDYPDDDY